MLSVKHVGSKIWLVQAKTSEELAKCFIRAQEYYESPNPMFRGNTFSLADYKKWYVEQYGNWTYYKDWGGFNVPREAILVLKDCFKKKNKYEQSLLKVLSPMLNTGNNFYVIGVPYGKEKYLKHEVAHGLWKMNWQYRNDMTELVSKIPRKIYNKYETFLLEKGYCKQVIEDEIQAYVLDGYIMEVSKTLKHSFEVVFNYHSRDMECEFS